MMKKILHPATLLLIIVYVLVACNKEKKEEPVKTTQGAAVSLRTCNDVSGARICFDSLLSESRCPEGGMCIWEGYAMIKVSFQENGNVHRLKMALTPSKNNLIISGLGAVNDTTINGYKITFDDLLPYPKTTGPAPTPDLQKAMFTIAH